MGNVLHKEIILIKEMRIIKVNQLNPNPKIIKQTANVLRKGGIIVYPTDTAYGLGGNALNENTIRKIYEVKERDFAKPTHVIVRDWKMIEKLCWTNNLAKIFYNKFLPGLLTMILKKKDVVPNILTASLPTLGVRIPNNPVTKLVSYSVTFPYTTPSANKSGGNTPYSIDEVKKELDIEKVDLILDAGKLPKVLPSTIVDLTNEVPKIIREGAISKKGLKETLSKFKQLI